MKFLKVEVRIRQDAVIFYIRFDFMERDLDLILRITQKSQAVIDDRIAQHDRISGHISLPSLLEHRIRDALDSDGQIIELFGMDTVAEKGLKAFLFIPNRIFVNLGGILDHAPQFGEFGIFKCCDETDAEIERESHLRAEAEILDTGDLIAENLYEFFGNDLQDAQFVRKMEIQVTHRCVRFLHDLAHTRVVITVLQKEPFGRF